MSDKKRTKCGACARQAAVSRNYARMWRFSCQPWRMTNEEPRRIKSVEERLINHDPPQTTAVPLSAGARSEDASVSRDQFQVAIAGAHRWGRGGRYAHRVKWMSNARRKNGQPKRIDTACGLTFYEGTLLNLAHYDCPRCP